MTTTTLTSQKNPAAHSLRDLQTAQLNGSTVNEAGLLTVTPSTRFIIVIKGDTLLEHLAARAK